MEGPAGKRIAVHHVNEGSCTVHRIQLDCRKAKVHLHRICIRQIIYARCIFLVIRF